MPNHHRPSCAKRLRTTGAMILHVIGHTRKRRLFDLACPSFIVKAARSKGVWGLLSDNLFGAARVCKRYHDQMLFTPQRVRVYHIVMDLLMVSIVLTNLPV